MTNLDKNYRSVKRILRYAKGISNATHVMDGQILLLEAMLIQIMLVILTKVSPPQVMCLLLLEDP